MQQGIAHKCYNYLILFIILFGRLNSTVKKRRFFINDIDVFSLMSSALINDEPSGLKAFFRWGRKQNVHRLLRKTADRLLSRAFLRRSS